MINRVNPSIVNNEELFGAEALAVLPEPCWIWSDLAEPAPHNRLTWFRRVVELQTLPDNATLRLAADSNAHLWINGFHLRRKVTRYVEEQITSEVVNARPYLRPGRNVVVVLHHNWGDIQTFQRTGNRHAGLWMASSWVNSDPSWRCVKAPEFFEHHVRILNVLGHDRIRYAQIIDGRKAFASDVHDPEFDDRAWEQVEPILENRPWAGEPTDVETPCQREYFVAPLGILAAGSIASPHVAGNDPLAISAAIRQADLRPDDALTLQAGRLLNNTPLVLEGHAGSSFYVTFDFHRPVHGFPVIELADATAGVILDLGYCELSRALYDGRMHVGLNGAINPEGVVGRGYCDRYITRAGSQSVELPDERTMRWLAVHVHFVLDGKLVIDKLGCIKSQYPVRILGSFACGDERVEQIVKLCQIHAEINMTDAYVDTPSREDAQWLEDAHLRALLAERWYGDDRLRKVLIRTHAQAQQENGHLHPFAPSNFPAYPSPYDWAVQWLACIHDDYLWSGKTDLICKNWGPITLLWENVLANTNEDGRWVTPNVLADLRVSVACTGKDSSSGIVTPWIIERLEWSIQMAEAIGERACAASWREVATRMRAAFRKYHVIPAKNGLPVHVADCHDAAHPEGPRGYSQAGQTIAITACLLTPEEARADMEYAFPAPDGTPPPAVTRWNNPTYLYRVLNALQASGLARRAVAHMVERYAPYLPGNPRNTVPLQLQGPYGGPLPEYWISREDAGLKPGEANFPQPPDETGSHGWGAVALLWLHDSLLGVRILQPGGGRIRIAPNAAGLPYVAGSTMTPKGIVWVHWDPQQPWLEIQLPTDVTAELVLPSEMAMDRLLIDRAPAEIKAAKNGSLLLAAAGSYVFRSADHYARMMR